MAKPNRGAALALVLWGLVVGGVVLTLVTLLAVQEQRAASALRQEERGLVGAERVGAELNTRLTAGQLHAGLSHAFDSLALSAGTEWSALVRRLAPDLFLLEVSPRVAGLASREAASVRLGWLLRPKPDSFAPVAAVSVGGPVALGDDVVISGVDDCAPPDSAIAGIAAESVFIRGSALLYGAPPQVSGASGNPGLSTRFAERANLVLPGGSYTPSPATVGTSCDVRSLTNWGDPGNSNNPCGGYFPLVEVDGDLTLDGGLGQGILLVNGNLHVTSGFIFHGIVIVTEAADITAPTDISGNFVAAELRSGAGPVSQLKVRYSKCIISNVLETLSPLSPLLSRAWNQLFQAP